MIYDAEARMQIAREHAELLAEEMRRARGLAPQQAGYLCWTRVAGQLLGRVERLSRGKRHPAHAYDA